MHILYHFESCFSWIIVHFEKSLSVAILKQYWRNVEEMLVEEMLGSSIYDTILWVVVFTKLSNNWQIYNLKCWVIPGYLVPFHPWLATTPYGAELILLTFFIKLARIINYKLQIELTIYIFNLHLLGHWFSFIELHM